MNRQRPVVARRPVPVMARCWDRQAPRQ